MSLAAILAAVGAPAEVLNLACLEDWATGPTNCTANDVTFVLVGLGVQDDGCVASGFGTCFADPLVSCASDLDCGPPPDDFCEFTDTVSIKLKAVLRNTTAQARYDIGMWFANDGDPSLCSGNFCTETANTACASNSDCPGGPTDICLAHRRCVTDADCTAFGYTCEAPDGARRGECGREMLHPVGVCAGSPTTKCTRDLDCGPGGTCHAPGLCSGDGTTVCAIDSDCTPQPQTCDYGATCPPLDLTPAPGATGIYLTEEGDTNNSTRDWCGDLLDGGAGTGCDEEGDGIWDDSEMEFVEAQVFPCADTDSDGFLNIPTCASWGNQPDEVHIGLCRGGADEGDICTADNQCTGGTCDGGFCVGGTDPPPVCVLDSECNGGICVGAGDTCDSEFEVVAGTPAKCRCEDLNSDVPAPAMDLTCSCDYGDPVVLPGPGDTISCSVSYSNPIVCTDPVPPSTDPRFRCGTASYLRFQANDILPLSGNDPPDDAGGTFTNVVAGDGSASGGGEILWVPNPEGVITYEGIVGPSTSGTVNFDYTVPGTVPGPINVETVIQWSNVHNDFSSAVDQSLSVSCPITADFTWASISEFRAYDLGGRLMVEWRTDAEVSTAAFELYRLDERADTFLQVGEGPVSSLQRSEGAVYRVVDDGVGASGRLTYSLVEITSTGAKRSHGLFEVSPTRPGRRMDAAGFEAGVQAFTPSAETHARLARARRESSRPGRRGPAMTGPGGGRYAAVKASVASTDLYEVTSDQLAAFWGVPEFKVRVELAKGQVMVSTGGEEVAWKASPDGRRLWFFGEAPESELVPANVYWLELGRGTPAGEVSAGRVITTSDPIVFRDLVTFEEGGFPATVVASEPDSDWWFWESVIAGHPVYGTKTFSFDVADVGPAAADTAVHLELFGATDTVAAEDHHAVVRLNGVEIGATHWDGIGTHEVTLPAGAGILVSGANQLEITGLLTGGVSFGAFYVDSFGIEYDRRYRAADDRLRFRGDRNSVVTVDGFSEDEILVFDVTDPKNPIWVSNTTIDVGQGYRVSLRPSSPEAEYLAVTGQAVASPVETWLDQPSNLLHETRGAEYVVVAPRHLLEAASRLTEHRAGQGLRTMLVDVEDVFDEWRHGRSHPGALRDFLQTAYGHWNRPPRFVVLAGAGTLDYRDHLGLGGNLIPPLMAPTPSGLFAADLGLGDVVGEDGVPEIAIGRIPALTAAELHAYVDKLEAFEAAAGQPWRERSLVLADNADRAGNFPADSDRIAALLPPEPPVEKVYLSELPLAEARQRLFSELEAGVGYVNYGGHGGMDRLAAEGLLLSSDVPGLANTGKTPIMASLTCVMGRHEFPGFDSLAEALILEPEAGTVALWSPSGLSYSIDAALLNGLFVREAVASEGTRLGDAILEALRRYAEDGSFDYMLWIYNILGDPAAIMN